MLLSLRRSTALALLHSLVAATVANAQSTSSTDQLSVGAAVGIAVAVSVTVCTGVAAIVICLLARRFRRLPSGRQQRSGNFDNQGGHHGNNRNAGDQSQQSIIKFVEEGSGTAAQSAAMRAADVQLNSKHPTDRSEETHTISVKVASPDDLRFKVCRADGEIRVATDPVHSSLCSREGVRSGDRILGVHVDIKGAAGAHPKEVSELLSLCSDYGLTVEFQHRGQILRGPPETPTGKQRQRPVSAAEKALRKNRDRPVEVVDGPPAQPPPEQPQPPARHYSAEPRSRNSGKPHAPPPPEDRDSVFGIRDRRKRQQPLGSSPSADSDSDDRFERLCDTLALAEPDEAEWQPLAPRLLTLQGHSVSFGGDSGDAEESGSDGAEEETEETLVMAQPAPRLAASAGWQKPPSVERIYDHYELEEQDVVAAMAPPSAERPVVDCCTQFDGDDRGGHRRLGAVDSAEAEAEAEAEAVWLAAPAWECLPNHPELPAAEAAVSCRWVSLVNWPLVPMAVQSWESPPSADQEEETTPEDVIVWGETTQDDVIVWGETTQDDVIVWRETTQDDVIVWGETTQDDVIVGGEKTQDDVIVGGETTQDDISEEGETTDVMVSWQDPSDDGVVFEQSLASSMVAAAVDAPGVAVDDADEADDGDDVEADRELANYLAAAAAGDSTASSSVLTVQEEAVVEVLLTKDRAAAGGYHREDSLMELTRSMALRDVEVATVILLDSEAHHRLDLETASSSGRSTVQEDSIDPAQAPERPARQGDDFGLLDDLAGFEEAAMLHADFELAAAEWAARATPPPTPPSTPPHEVFVADDEAADAQRQSPLLDPGLMSEIVQGAQDIWEDADVEEAATAEDFELDDSELTGESLDRLLDRLEEKEEY